MEIVIYKRDGERLVGIGIKIGWEYTQAPVSSAAIEGKSKAERPSIRINISGLAVSVQPLWASEESLGDGKQSYRIRNSRPALGRGAFTSKFNCDRPDIYILTLGILADEINRARYGVAGLEFGLLYIDVKGPRHFEF